MSHDKQRERRRPNECIWYVLATVGGEPAKARSEAEMERMFSENQRYWNGVMKRRTTLLASVYETLLGEKLDLPTWTAEDDDAIRAALDARGFEGVNIPNFNNDIDFSCVDFPNSAYFDGFLFGGDTDFEGARFNGEANVFSNVVFTGRVSFNCTEFSRTLIVNNAKFLNSASFNSAKFREVASFSRCEFRSDAGYDGAHFTTQARFDRCDFGDGANFANAQFHDRADFRAAQFKGQTRFNGATFSTLVPEFFGATLNEDTDWHQCEWPAIPQESNAAREQIRRYQCLARSMADLQKFTDHHRFFKKELQIQRRVERWSLATVMNWFYEKICDYGFGLSRVSICWLVHWLAGAVLLCVSNIRPLMDQRTFWEATQEAFSNFGSAAKVSLGNALGFLNLNSKFFGDAVTNVESVPCFEGVGVAQAILGVILLFFLLLTVRNRFRMR